MKSRLIPILLAGACLNLARADFNPVTLTPSSYTFDIVVPATYVAPVPECINVTAGAGATLGDNTYYEQGLYNRPGLVGWNSGIPTHNTLLTNINNASMTFLMPPDYTVNNEVMIDSSYGSDTITFQAPTTATSLSFLSCGGGGPLSVSYTVTHADTTTETGTLNLLDWFNGGSTVAWGANGRMDTGGDYNNFNNSAVNNNAPYLYANTITVSGASPVVSVTLSGATQNHGNFFAVSGSNGGATWTPIPLTPDSYNVMGIIPATSPFPVTATMDQGTNLAYNGNLATWFEQGFDRSYPNAGLPPSGSELDSVSQPTHHYQLASYSANNAILIDTNHLVANITPASPASYSSFALLTAGGNVGSPPMTNLCVLQHADGVQETNLFLGYDWFDNNHNSAIAFKAGGRCNLANRTDNQINNNYPYLFETYFLVADTGSPVTNIVVQYVHANSSSSTTYVMALSAASGGIPPVVNVGPVPDSQTLGVSQTATFTAGAIGTAPITGYWQKDNNGVYQTLSDGPSGDGSIIIGSHTFSLTISNLFLPDGTNYQFVVNNAFGSGTSSPASLIVTPETISITPAAPVFYTSNNVTLTSHLAPATGPAVGLQWFYVDNSGDTNEIAGATGSTYTIADVQDIQNGFIYGVVATNSYGTNIASVPLNVSDSYAFLAADLSPTNAEAYAGAQVTYFVNAQGNSPINFLWTTNGVVVGGVNSNSFTLATPLGTTAIQVSFTNLLSGGTPAVSSIALLQGDASPTNITFNTTGIGWQTNGSVPNIATNTLQLTDGNGGEASSAFYNVAQYVGGNWTASYIYNSHGGAADGTAFVLQTTNPVALGGSGGSLGYGGIPGNSLAFEINLYGGNNETPGVTLALDGATGIYQSAAPVSTTSTNPISVVLSFANGVLAASLTDLRTGTNYSTNYVVGPLTSVLGGNLAYIGFTGGDGGATSFQTVSNFLFHSVLPPVALSVSPASNGKITLSWPNADYQVQVTSSLSSPTWTAGPTATVVNGVSQVTVSVTGSGAQFYRLVRVAP
ncbi:MAG: hypothetical protein ABSH48_14240 [Verrucomicrobiota bacterium]